MKAWEEFNIDLKEFEQNHYTTCPKCFNKRKNKNKKTLFVNLTLKSWFCNHCGFAGDLIYGDKALTSDGKYCDLNPNISDYHPTLNLSTRIISSFNNMGISKDTLHALKIEQRKVYLPDTEEDINMLAFPYYKEGKLVNIIYFDKGKRYSEFGGSEICYGYDDIKPEETYIVADEFEKMALWEAGIKNAISLYGGNHIKKQKSEFNLDFLANIEKGLKSVSKIVIAMPHTTNGQLVTEELLRRLGKERCWTIKPPGKEQNWQTFLKENNSQIVQKVLTEAKAYPVKGLFEIDDVEDDFDLLYEMGLKKGVSTGFRNLDPYYTVVPGQWTVVTGIPNHGKSNFLDAVLVNLASLHDWKIGIFSPENQPVARHFANILEKYAKAPFNFGGTVRMTPEQKDLGKQWLKDHFTVILPDEDDNWSLDGILSLAKVLVYRKGIKGLVIDPWNEIDHSRTGKLTETEYISEALTKIRRFARTYDVHVWVVAHPAKLYKGQDGKYPVPTPYDISGSAHWRNKADNAFTVWRNVGGKDECITDVHVQKVRFKEVGRVGMSSLSYDVPSGTFIDNVDQEKRMRALTDGEEFETKYFTRKGK